MLFKFLIGVVFAVLSVFASEGGKFVVMDNGTFDKLQTLKVLDGGLKKQIVLSSTKLSSDDLKIFYPEYFLYSGEKCTLINDVVNIHSKNSGHITINKLTEDKEKEVEVKKIKLLQILVDSNDKKTTVTPNEKSLKALGMICDGEVKFQGQKYINEDQMGNLKIESISTLNSVVYVK